MAKKSMFFSVTVKDGYDEVVLDPVPARTKDHATLYFQTNTIKVTAVKYLGQWDVLSYSDPSNGVIFYATDPMTVGPNAVTYQYEVNQIGYNHLKSLFLKQYMSGLDELD
jgi:hypothetical protein